MSEAEQPTPHSPAPGSLVAAAAALSMIDEAIRTAHDTPADGGRTGPEVPSPDTEDALAALLLLREVRQRLAGWEPVLIEAARAAGASWADLAGPLGVA
ncbi:type III effector protein, partial [Streptomyces sp. Act-28]